MMAELALDKAKVRRSFAAAARTYDDLAELQRQVGLELLRQFPVEAGDGPILDVGCGTGFLTDQLCSANKPLLALDIAMPMLQISRQKYPGMSTGYVCADAEKLPFANNSIEQIYSNLALQWAQDLPATFRGFKQVLRSKGRLVLATFGPKTLHELKTAWAAVDDYVHVNDFLSAKQIELCLLNAGFGEVCIESVVYQTEYPSVEALMRELKGIGAHNVNNRRNHKLTTRSQLHSMIRRYQAEMTGRAIVATYEILFVQARPVLP
ncbi:MAG: malonyl-[acyl-carrier protein] O-methyltransferase BioC [Methylomonas sp.]|nr:MAG: malonyl-[acyl-carrier protein] O-methyltransferase BioC [Methylomonas sp.]